MTEHLNLPDYIEYNIKYMNMERSLDAESIFTTTRIANFNSAELRPSGVFTETKFLINQQFTKYTQIEPVNCIFLCYENSADSEKLSNDIDNDEVKIKAKKHENHESGFTLIELLVVLSILGVLFALVGPRVSGALAGANVQAANIQIEKFRQTLEFYRMDIGEYPTTEQGLIALLEEPSDPGNWNGPYLNDRTIPADPWGNDYVYKSTESGGYELFSLGADNRPGGDGVDADIGGDHLIASD